jgi:hypothetical protein
MLPIVCFYSVVYVLSFLSQAPYIEGNQVDCTMLSELFASALFGHSVSDSPQLLKDVLSWLLENWSEISIGILKEVTTLDSGAEALQGLCFTQTTEKLCFTERARRLSRTGRDSFPKMATIEDASVADTSDFTELEISRPYHPQEIQDSRTYQGQRASDSTNSLGTGGQNLDGQSVAEAASSPELATECVPLNLQPQTSEEDDEKKGLQLALQDAQRKLVALATAKEEQAEELRRSRFALAKAEREASEVHLKLEVPDFNQQPSGVSTKDLESLEAELTSAKEERDTALDIIEAIKGTLQI